VENGAGIAVETVGLEKTYGEGATAVRALQDVSLTFPNGEQQRVAIARALIRFPDIILADEPTGNLDSRTGAEVLGLLRESAARFDQTILMVTHDPRAAATAGRAVFLSDGRVVDEALDPDQDEILERIKTLESRG
jgi:putative ABC transport system ATP-binding protein